MNINSKKKKNKSNIVYIYYAVCSICEWMCVYYILYIYMFKEIITHKKDNGKRKKKV